MTQLRIVNVPDLSPGDIFFDLNSLRDRSVEWVGHSGQPKNGIERFIRRPRLSRYRAALNAVRDARNGIIISHLPRMTAAVERFARFRHARTPHLAFSFNFTDLPQGPDLRRLAKDFAPVERFCVYSHFEAALYPNVFNVEPDRFHHVMWAQDTPVTDCSAPVPDGPFVIAIGGEGRDIATMIAAAKARPELHWMVVARPNRSFEHAPSNMTVLFNYPAPLTWGLAKRSAAVVVPLLTDTTCCGHITIASAQLLGLPVITTRSYATEEYLHDMPLTSVVEPQDAEAIALAVPKEAIHSDVTDTIARARERYDRRHWSDFVGSFVADHSS